MYRELLKNCEGISKHDAAIVSKVLEFYPLQEKVIQSSTPDSNITVNYTNTDILLGILLKLHASLFQGHTRLPLKHIANKKIFCSVENSDDSPLVSSIKSDETTESSSDKLFELVPSNLTQVDLQKDSAKKEEANDNIEVGIAMPSLEILTDVIQTWLNAHQPRPPYVLSGQHLMIKRYYDYESFIFSKVNEFRNYKTLEVNEYHQQIFAQLFEGDAAKTRQAQAVACSLVQQFMILNGGPGTGKTYTVARMLVMLRAIFPNLQIELAAPTGKAAQRLSESLQFALDNLKSNPLLTEICEKLPAIAQTIHKLIGTQPGSASVVKNHANPIMCDLLIIDEFSMVDTALFAKVLNACKPKTKIILVGDAQQLPSVEPGNVLKDLVFKSENTKSNTMCDYLEQMLDTKFDSGEDIDNDHIVTLEQNHRSNESINKIANFVINQTLGELNPMLAGNHILPEATSRETYLSKQNALLNNFVQRYANALKSATSVQALFELVKTFRILSPVRKGQNGVESINKWFCERVLYEVGNTRFADTFHGQPIMIAENDASSGLSNGDFGIVWQDSSSSGQLIAYIERENRPPLKLSVNRLPRYETSFALTIHKTQGSEFEHVLLILPFEATQGCTRELLYTGITRAKNDIQILARENVLQTSLSLTNKRSTYLSLLV